MSERLDPRPLSRALIDGLRNRANIGHEEEDRFTKLFIFGVPITVFILCVILGFKLTGGSDLLAGAAILIGALLAGFAQLASWRERLTARNAKIDGPQKRMIDEAVAHVLVATVTSGIFALSIGVALNSSWTPLTVVASSLTASLGVYLCVTLYVVTNLLWLTYRAVNPESKPLRVPGEDSAEGSHDSQAS